MLETPAPPAAVLTTFPDPAGLPTPLGCAGLNLLLVSADPAAIHDAFLASAAVLGGNGTGSVRLALTLPPAPVSNANAPSAADDSNQAASAAATEAVALAQGQLPAWAETLGLPSPGNLTLELVGRPTQATQQAEAAFHVVVCSSIPAASRDELLATLQSIHASLKQGGEAFLNVLLSHRRLSGLTPEQLEAVGVGAAGYIGDFLDCLRRSGFLQPRIMRMEPHELEEDHHYLLAGTKLSLCTIRAQKNRLLEPSCEDYGMWVVYRGSVEGCEEAYVFDLRHKFVKNAPAMVCGNTAAMLGEQGISWLTPHFVVTGDRAVHFGSFTSRMYGGDACCLP